MQNKQYREKPRIFAGSFDTLAQGWWDSTGYFSMLHKLQPVRMRYLRHAVAQHFANESLAGLRGLRVLDVGCGGGLLSEAVARLGGETTGIDASESSIDVARAHAKNSELAISYHYATLAEFAATKPSPPRFDLLCAMEIIEHVEDQAQFLNTAASLLRPGGLLLLSTLNRTRESWLKGIIVAEHLLRLLPRGTHDWSRFVTPFELENLARDAGLRIKDFCGMRYRLLAGDFVLNPKILSFNYIASACKEI